MMNIEKFVVDVNQVTERLSIDESDLVIRRINNVKNRLIDLYRRNIVKINHSILEVICAKHFIKYGYEVDVERQLNEILVCDIYATKGDNILIAEIETGFVPPEHALDPLAYTTARVASKISRYSAFADKFALAVPLLSILPIQRLFLKPPRYRNVDEVSRIKALCDRYYSNPPIKIEEIKNARLHSVLVINTDDAKVKEMDPEAYVELVKSVDVFNGYLT